MLENGTIFDVTKDSFDRSKVKWEDHMGTLTPVQKGERVWYKREDWWAPLGYGGVNGFKARQATWLFKRYAEGATRVLFAGSVKSTQHGQSAVLARYFGLPSTHVMGATSPETCVKHETVAIAQAMGGEFDFIKVAYNPSLRKRLRELSAANPGSFVVAYGLGLDHKTHTAEEVRLYHEVGASQAANIPDHIDRVVIPAGSCHAAISVMLGLHRLQRSRTVDLVGVGPKRLSWMQERLAYIGMEFRFDLGGNFQLWQNGESFLAGRLHDLLGSKYCTYQDRWTEEHDGIVFHPTYEAKVMRYLHEVTPHLLSERTLVWVIGSEPRLSVLQPWVDGRSSRRE